MRYSGGLSLHCDHDDMTDNATRTTDNDVYNNVTDNNTNNTIRKVTLTTTRSHDDDNTIILNHD